MEDENEEALEVAERIDKRKLLEEKKKEKQIKKSFYQRVKELSISDKAIIVTTIIAAIALFLSALNAYMLFSGPNPKTEVIYGGENLLIEDNGGDYARWEIGIKNKGTDEAEGVSLEMTFPDGSTIDWRSRFIGWEGNWSRKPDYIETNDNYCLMRWNYLSAHGTIKVDLAINLPIEYPHDAKVDPKKILVTAKGEKSPIHEYP